jgi:hypothetical protein
VNVLLLAIAFRAWSGSAVSAFLRLIAAIGAFSLELQVATGLHVGNIRSLRLLNLAAASAGIGWHAHRARLRRAESVARSSGAASPYEPVTIRLPPVPAIAALALIVVTLALMRPVIGADPYHLHRVDQITSLGTLAYDPAAPDIKVNALAGVYELLLADLRIPGMSTALVRLHGLFGLGLYLLAVAATASWFQVRRRWTLIVWLVVPVVFHQLVLVKNDLFGALPAFVALAWVVGRGGEMSWSEVGAASALAGFAVGIKISSAPLALVVVAFVVADHWRDWRAGAAALAAGAGGAVAGGLLFTLAENQLVYGGAMQPYMSLGNRHEDAGAAIAGIGRFALSLVDVGTVTPRLWPGRGGWGSTFGLPLLWALVVLGRQWRQRHAARALIAAGACFIVLGATYPDADIAHRLVIAPALLLIAVALGCVEGDARLGDALRAVLVGVIVLSALQVLRSAVLYAQTA